MISLKAVCVLLHEFLALEVEVFRQEFVRNEDLNNLAAAEEAAS